MSSRDAGPGVWQHRQRVVYLRHTGGAGASVYVASKHAVEGLTKSAALEASGPVSSQCGCTWSDRYWHAYQVYRQ